MRTITGVVTSNKMEKTVVVSVDTYKSHPKYHKKFKVTNKFFAHDENNIGEVGKVVTIQESRPLSKKKRWSLV